MNRQQLVGVLAAHLDKEVRGVWQEEDWEPERVAEELLDIVEEDRVLMQRHHEWPKPPEPSHSAMKDEMVERASTSTADAIKAEQAEQREKFYPEPEPDPSEPGVPGNDDDRYNEPTDNQ